MNILISSVSNERTAIHAGESRRRRRACLLCAAAIFLGSRPAWSEPSVERLDLAASITRAREAHPDLEVERAELRKAEAEISRAEAGRWFRGSFRGIYGVVNGAEVGAVPEGLPAELAPLFSPDDRDDLLNDLSFFTRNELRLTQPIYTFGKIARGISAARAGAEAREAEVTRRAGEVTLEVKRLYYGYKLASALHGEMEETAASFSEAIEEAEERVESGAVSRADVLKLELARDRVERRMAELRRRRDVALGAYRRALGLPASIAVEPDRDPLTAVEVDGLPPLEELERDYTSTPEWRAATRGLRARRERVEAARRRIYPDLFVGGFVEIAWAPGRDDITNPFLRDPYNEVRGGPFLGVRWNLDFVAQRAEIDLAEAEAAKRRAQVERARLGIPLAIRRAYLRYREKRRALEIARSSRKSGRSLALLTAANFRMGLGEAEEVLEALGMHLEATSRYHRALFEYNMAVAELSQRLGRELDRELGTQLAHPDRDALVPFPARSHRLRPELR